jgi:ABC-type antimicrobial peptide transport system permease subunit
MVTLFIIAFAMAFLMLSQDEGFTTIPISFLTTFVMMTGEMDFRDTFLGNGTSAFTILQKLFLMLFLLLITIAIMNLFTGLAVGDTAEIMKRANQERRLYKVSCSHHNYRKRMSALTLFLFIYLKLYSMSLAPSGKSGFNGGRPDYTVHTLIKETIINNYTNT